MMKMKTKTTPIKITPTTTETATIYLTMILLSRITYVNSFISFVLIEAEIDCYADDQIDVNDVDNDDDDDNGDDNDFDENDDNKDDNEFKQEGVNTKAMTNLVAMKMMME